MFPTSSEERLNTDRVNRWFINITPNFGGLGRQGCARVEELKQIVKLTVRLCKTSLYPPICSSKYKRI